METTDRWDVFVSNITIGSSFYANFKSVCPFAGHEQQLTA